MKYVLYPHGGSGNHGCEAIVRSTAKLLGGDLTLFSNQVEEDVANGLDALCAIRAAEMKINRSSFYFASAFMRYRLFGQKDAFDRLVFRELIKTATSADYLLGIGGDNYCYGTPAYIYLVNQMLDEMGVPRILWGASVEPDSIDATMLKDLKGYHKIWARESLTYQALVSHGLNQTVLLPDPAFVLDKKELPLPEGFIEGNTVGINISPMIIGYAQRGVDVLANYKLLIQHIIDRTGMNVALIPHVVWNHNDDRKPLKHLYEMFRGSKRVCMLEDCNCEELKGYIAKCRFAVVARTHASIAAYSTCVPTLVVGYSIKAKGIAKDIFGNERHYVIPVQSLRKDTDLTECFIWMYRNEDNIRLHLKQFIPEYISVLKEPTLMSKTLDL